MLSFKKVYRDELLQLALILSLLRCHSDTFYDHDLIDLPNEHFDIENGTSWRSFTSNALRSYHVHPKNFDVVLLNYERDMFADINSLGRCNQFNLESIRRSNITAYLLNVNRTSSPTTTEPLGGGVSVHLVEEPPPGLDEADVLQRLDPLIGEGPVLLRDGYNAFDSGIDLTQEDMDLIEVLWKQDVDLGFSMDIQQQQQTKTSSSGASVSSTGCEDPIVGGGSKSPGSCASVSSGYNSPKKGFTDNETEQDYIEKLSVLKEINGDKIKVEPASQDSDPWAGLDYTIDTETGEYVIKGELDVSLDDATCVSTCDALDDLSLPLPEFLLEDALQLVGIDDDISQDVSEDSCKTIADEDPARPAASQRTRDSDVARAAAGLASPNDLDAPQPGSIASALLDAAAHVATDGVPHGPDRLAALALDDADDGDDDDDDDLRLIDTMIQTSQFHHPHHSRAFQGRMPFVRAVSIEQHWQDLANLLSMPPGHHPSQQSQQPQQPHHVGGNDAYQHPHPHQHQYGGGGTYHLQTPPPAPPSMHHHHHHHHPHHHVGMAAMGGNMTTMGGTSYCPAENTRNVLLHNATLNPPIGELNATGSGPSMAAYGNLGGGTNLGNAVATSMNLTNSSEPMGDSGPGPHYKLEPTHDLLYYQNTTSELNQTDGLLSSILNDEDLQLMDMAMNEGMYTMRMLDNANSTSVGSILNPAAQHLAMSNGTGASVAPTAGGGAIASSVPSSVSSQGQAAQTHRTTDLDRLDTASDSAVSSMGSERVPSISDGEWGDAGSDSGHTAGDHYVTDYHRKFGPYDYSYSSRQHTGGMTAAETRIPPVAQKKHQMYGKRYFQEQGNTLPTATPASAPTPPIPIKYEYRDSCIGTAPSSYHHTHQHVAETAAATKALDTKYYGHGAAAALPLHHHHGPLGLDHIQHNHTYHLPVISNTGAMQRPVSRDKCINGSDKAAKLKKAEEEHLSRDEKRARSLNVPISVDDIINLPMDEFNERLSKYDLSETQLSLIRDIRRRGKNKVAAQNCRKRKLDQILTLADEVKDMRDRKIRLINDHTFVTSESIRIKEKYQQLYRHVFQNLRDPDGNHYSPYQYSLQTSADGSILVVPLSTSNNNHTERKEQHPPQKD